MQLKSTKQTLLPRKSQVRHRMLKIKPRKLDLSNEPTLVLSWKQFKRIYQKNTRKDDKSKLQGGGHSLQFDKKTARR